MRSNIVFYILLMLAASWFNNFKTHKTDQSIQIKRLRNTWSTDCLYIKGIIIKPLMLL